MLAAAKLQRNRPRNTRKASMSTPISASWYSTPRPTSAATPAAAKPQVKAEAPKMPAVTRAVTCGQRSDLVLAFTACIPV
ncbi:hypothetical protein G6F54_014564 [Rhizopus delemar]|nr:hypothetical protein G6F54_014564 [Rhizopus delemar]